jgi:hypothetical protein
LSLRQRICLPGNFVSNQAARERTEAVSEVQRVENLLHLPDEPAPNWPSPEDAAA